MDFGHFSRLVSRSRSRIDCGRIEDLCTGIFLSGKQSGRQGIEPDHSREAGQNVKEAQRLQLTKDQIAALSAGVVKIDVENERWADRTYRLKARIVADPDELIKRIGARSRKITKRHYTILTLL
jgi:hypothetical protein